MSGDIVPRHPEPQKIYWEGLVPASIGTVTLLVASDWHGLLFLMALPGTLMLIAAGLGLLLWPGDSRLPQFGCLGSVVGVLPLPLCALSGEALSALGVLLGLSASYLACARVSLLCFVRVEGAPPPAQDLSAAAHIGTDEILLGWFLILAKPPRGDKLAALSDEMSAWEDWLKRKRMGRRLERLHPAPPDLLKVSSNDRQQFGRKFRHIQFPSGYAPEPDMPGAQRWLEIRSNHDGHAWILEHAGAARPWLLAIHGYRMGHPLMDLRVFDPRFFHDKLGLNVAACVLPLHGPRKFGLFSGDGYLEGQFMDFIHAEMQAQWDLRRLLSWLRLVKHAPKIGVYGVSLGGYNTALLAGLDKQLDCAVAGIPVVDMAAIQWRHFPAPERTALAQQGIDEARLSNAYGAVAPLNFAPHLPADRLGIFAGSLDQLVWPDQPLRLQQHWQGAELAWYRGAHLTFNGQPAVTRTLTRTLEAAGMLA